jgi:hypothetical protein
MDFLDAREFTPPKLEFLCGTLDIGASASDLLCTRAANQFVEARLPLRKHRLRFREARPGPPTVLLNQDLPGHNRFAFCNRNCLNWLTDFC